MAEYISGSRVVMEGHLCNEGTARLMMLDVLLFAESHASTHHQI
jgi:hypothetical protein